MDSINAMPTSVIKVNHSNTTTDHKSMAASSAGSIVSSTSTSKSSANANAAKSLDYAVASTTDSHAIVRVSVVEKKKNGMEVPPMPERERLYQFFDEEYLSMVSKNMGWPRDRGVVELIPIVVGMGVLE